MFCFFNGRSVFCLPAMCDIAETNSEIVLFAVNFRRLNIWWGEMDFNFVLVAFAARADGLRSYCSVEVTDNIYARGRRPTLSANTPAYIPAVKEHGWCSLTSNGSFHLHSPRSWILPSYFWLHWSDRTVSQSTQWCAVPLLGYYTNSHRVRSYHSLKKRKLTWSVLGECMRDDSFFALERWESCRGWLALWVFINCTEAFQAVFREQAPFLLISIWQEAI